MKFLTPQDLINTNKPIRDFSTLGIYIKAWNLISENMVDVFRNGWDNPRDDNHPNGFAGLERGFFVQIDESLICTKYSLYSKSPINVIKPDFLMWLNNEVADMGWIIDLSCINDDVSVLGENEHKALAEDGKIDVFVRVQRNQKGYRIAEN